MPRAVFIIVILMLAVPAMAEDRKAEIGKWLKALADREPATRANARRVLMGLPPSELPLLREIVAASMPLRPAQIDPLEDIVTYIRTRESLLKLRRADSGFLGVSLPMMAFEQLNDDDDGATPTGVPVLSRLRGFVAYRMLEDGDIILAISSGGEPFRQTATPQQLKAVVSTLRAGDPVVVRLQRGAQFVSIQFSLDGAPLADDDERSTTGLVNDAEYEAEQYFKQHIAPLLGPQDI